MTVRAIDFRTCPVHGPDRVHHMGHCYRCVEEGIEVTPNKPLAEPVPDWMKRVIQNIGIKQDPARTEAIRRMAKWKKRRRTAAQERAEREARGSLATP